VLAPCGSPFLPDAPGFVWRDAENLHIISDLCLTSPARINRKQKMRPFPKFLLLCGALWFSLLSATQAQPAARAKAIFAGGRFWCMEPPFDKLPGVITTTSGYVGGQKRNPTYEEVSAGKTGHTEAVQVVYDPKKIRYQKLLEVFWRNIDPTAKNRQFCDVGTQYRSGIFYQDQEQKRLAEVSRAALENSKPFKDPIVTETTLTTEFWPAEEYHQDYYLKNPLRYTYYRAGCGRDARLKQLWGSAAE
jgi:peptide-methionine (S)-S-oxide reductase